MRGTHENSWITQARSRAGAAYARPLAVCAARDNTFYIGAKIRDCISVAALLRERVLRQKTLGRKLPYIFTLALATTSCCRRTQKTLRRPIAGECHHVVRLLGSHELRHALRVDWIHVRIRIQNQFPAVSVALPFSDNLHVYTFLNCTGNEHPAKRALAKWR